MKFKKSKYNINVDKLSNGEILIYNSVTSAFGIMDCETQAIYNNLDNINDNNLKDKNMKKNLNIMSNNGFIVEEDLDEFKKLMLEYKLYRYDRSGGLFLTIAPTMNCNMACPYCYEKKNLEKMSENTQQLLIKCIEDYIKRYPQITFISVSWYGGEPLLEKEIIRYLSKELIRICKENQREYTASIVTNGVLLDYDTALMLSKECNIYQTQITLDGVGEVHNKTRKLKSGEDSFSKITANIDDVKDLLQVVIRTNINKKNVDYFKDLVQYFKRKNWDGKVKLYFSPVTATEEVNKHVFNECYSRDEFNDMHIDLEKLLIDADINSNFTYPKSFLGCTALTVHNIVIDPNGNMSKCWHRIGNPKYYIGSVKEGIKFNKERIEWLTSEYPNKCVECKLFPICRSGCPHDRIKNNNEPICEYNLHQIREILKKYYKNLRIEQ